MSWADWSWLNLHTSFVTQFRGVSFWGSCCQAPMSSSLTWYADIKQLISMAQVAQFHELIWREVLREYCKILPDSLCRNNWPKSPRSMWLFQQHLLVMTNLSDTGPASVPYGKVPDAPSSSHLIQWVTRQCSAHDKCLHDIGTTMTR